MRVPNHYRPRGDTKRPSKEQLSQLLKAHEKKDIADMLGVSRQTVTNWAIHHGLHVVRPVGTAPDDLRSAARGQPCMIRLPGCDGGGETTVLAHYRLAGYGGVGLKVPDAMGAHACANCHDLVDGRRQLDGWTRDEIRLAHAEAVMRTAVERAR